MSSLLLLHSGSHRFCTFGLIRFRMLSTFLQTHVPRSLPAAPTSSLRLAIGPCPAPCWIFPGWRKSGAFNSPLSILFFALGTRGARFSRLLFPADLTA